MRKQFISLADTGRFSQLICDYLSEKKSLKEFYGVYPSLENAQIQINLKKDTYSKKNKRNSCKNNKGSISKNNSYERSRKKTQTS